jgi:sterol desaturase/sphingolipid hydroxylase (fatty acid hydroxylase superfamily)
MPTALKFDQNESIRLFDSPLLERLSHIGPLTVAVFWSTLSTALVIAGYFLRPVGAAEFLAALIGAFLGWTVFEYFIHRFLFHIGDWLPGGKRLSFLLHGCHHADPGDPTRNLMPLIASLPGFIGFFALFSLLLPLPSVLVLFGFFGFSYMAYDLTHYACHQLPMNNRVGAILKRHHLRHHFQDPTKGFAVTLPLWDRVFGTAGQGHGPRGGGPVLSS